MNHQRRHLKSSPFSAREEVPVETYVVGDRVAHDRYGLGTVTGLENGRAAKVDFTSHEQRITLPCRQMSKL